MAEKNLALVFLYRLLTNCLFVGSWRRQETILIVKICDCSCCFGGYLYGIQSKGTERRIHLPLLVDIVGRKRAEIQMPRSSLGDEQIAAAEAEPVHFPWRTLARIASIVPERQRPERGSSRWA
jgi:hypothetical protein